MATPIWCSESSNLKPEYLFELYFKFLKGSDTGNYIGEYYRVIKGNTRGLDCSSFDVL